MYYWIANSDDGAYEVDSIRDLNKQFKTKREAYDDMRNAALEKMKWNTEYDEDFYFYDDDPIRYKVTFWKRKIIHESYSGIYKYEIYEK